MVVGCFSNQVAFLGVMGTIGRKDQTALAKMNEGLLFDSTIDLDSASLLLGAFR